MHVFVVLVELGCIGLRCESREALFIDIHPKRLVASYNYIDSQVKFIAVNKQRVGYISGNNAQFVYIQVIDIVDDMDTSSSTRIAWLYDPDIAPWISLLQLLVMTQQISVLIWQDIGIWNEIESITTKFLLQFYVIEAKTIFSGNFIRVREVIDSLIFIQAFIEIGLTTTAGPKQVPLM